MLPATFNSCGERGEPTCGGAPLQAPLLPPQRTNVWLVAPKGIVQAGQPQPLKILGPPSPRFCLARDVNLVDGGPILTSSPRLAGMTVHRLVVRNIGGRSCQLDGAPAAWVSTPTVNVEPSMDDAFAQRLERVVLRPGDEASFLAALVQPEWVTLPAAFAPCLTSPRIHLRLPDHGGSLDLPDESVPADNTGARYQPVGPGVGETFPPTLVCATSLTTLTGFAAGPHADATLLDAARLRQRHA